MEYRVLEYEFSVVAVSCSTFELSTSVRGKRTMCIEEDCVSDRGHVGAVSL